MTKALRYKVVRLDVHSWTVLDTQTGRWVTDGGVTWEEAKAAAKSLNAEAK